MNIPGPAKLLTIYIGEGMQWQGKSLYHALVMKLKEAGIAGATVIRGVEGYGEANRLHTTRLLDLSADLPVIVEAVDQAEKIEKVLPEIQAMVSRGLITLADVQVIPGNRKPG